jgi:hypothetical protein
MKKSRISYLFLLMGMLLTLTIAGQKNFLPGYVITWQGDTLKGSIDYRNWGKNPDSFVFLDSRSGQQVIYLAGDVRRVYVNNEYYNSAVVKINERINDMDVVVLEWTPKVTLDTVLLLSLIEGDKSLYHLKLPNREDYFFYKDGDSIRTYLYSTFVTMKDNQRYLSHDNKYIGQMVLYFADCPFIKDRVYKAEYTMKSMRGVYDEYYECRGIEPTYEIPAFKPLEFGIMTGGSLSHIEYRELPWQVGPSGFPNSLDFTAGVFLNIIIPRNFQRWSIYSELNYTTYETENHFTSTHSDDNYYEYSTYLAESYLKLFFLPRYTYPLNRQWSVFGNLGVGWGLAFDQTDITFMDHYFYGNWSRVTYSTGLSRYQEIGLAAGAGIRYWKLHFETRFDKPLLASNSLPSYRLYFLLGFTF